METTKVLNNNHLSPDVESNINGLIASYDSFVSSHPELSALTPNLLATKALIPELMIKKGSRYVLREAVKYDHHDKIMYIGKVMAGIDYNHLFLKELIQINLSHANTTKALTEGLSSIIATNVVGNESENNLFLDEETIVCLLSQIVGFDAVISHVVNGSPTIQSGFKQLGVSDKETADLLSLIEHNCELRKTAGFSSLADIQNKLIEIYSKKQDLTKEDVENFELSLCKDSRMVSSPSYKNLDKVQVHFNQIFGGMELENQKTK